MMSTNNLLSQITLNSSLIEASLLEALSRLQHLEDTDTVKEIRMFIEYAATENTTNPIALKEKAVFAGIEDGDFAFKHYGVPPVVYAGMLKAIDNAKEGLAEDDSNETQLERLEELLDCLKHQNYKVFCQQYNTINDWTRQLIPEIVTDWVKSKADHLSVSI